MIWQVNIVVDGSDAEKQSRLVKTNGKLDLRAMQKVAEALGGKCLSSSFHSAKTYMDFECRRGHRFKMTPHRIRSQGGWCSVCIKLDSRQKLKSNLEQLAEDRGGKILSEEIATQHSKVKLECINGHLWRARAAHILHSGSWCPRCKTTVSENLVRLYFEAIFQIPFPNVKPKFLKLGPRRGLELDGFCEKLKLAFEFDGEQHFKERSFNLTKTAFGRIKDRDSLKTKLCSENGVTLLRFSYLDDLSELSQLIRDRIPANRNDLLLFNYNVAVDLNSAHVQKDKLAELQDIAKSRGGALLSEIYTNINNKYEWICGEGHVWKAKADHVKNSGSWCPNCADADRWDTRRKNGTAKRPPVEVPPVEDGQL